MTTCADPLKSIYLATLRARISHADSARNGSLNSAVDSQVGLGVSVAFCTFDLATKDMECLPEYSLLLIYFANFLIFTRSSSILRYGTKAR